MWEEPFETIWERIGAHEGEPFATTRGRPFTYRMAGDALHPAPGGRPTKFLVPRVQVAEAWRVLGEQERARTGPAALRRRVPELRGAAYVWAILNDPRIRGTG